MRIPAVAQLQRLRKVIEMYQLDHGATYPTLAQLQADWSVLTSTTNMDGSLSPAGAFGPYIIKAPVNPYTHSSTVAATGAATASHGWEYDETTGEIAAVGFDETTETFKPPS